MKVKTASAVENGRAMAHKALKGRRKQLKARAAAIEAREADERQRVRPRKKSSARQMRLVPTDMALAATRSRLGPAASRGILIAEGDSWFDYPRWDILKLLEDLHGYDVESVAHKGDRVEAMAYDGGQLDEFVRLIEKIVRRGEQPTAVLLSGGGNDIAGRQFEVILNHALAPTSGVDKGILESLVSVRLRESYETILSAIRTVCIELLGNPLPVVIHGYDYAVPDGRGFLDGWLPFMPGPWLEPGFRLKGYTALSRRKAEMVVIIDALNAMLMRLAKEPHNANVRYVDLRGTLYNGQNHEDDWGNELHPTYDGFEKIVKRIVAVL